MQQKCELLVLEGFVHHDFGYKLTIPSKHLNSLRENPLFRIFLSVALIRDYTPQ
jgi:hypothetical protein